MSKLEETLWFQMKVVLPKQAYPMPEREYRFYALRRWRADFCWPKQKIIVEVEGGIWTSGRHSRGGKSFLADMEKYNTAVILGYKLIRVAGDHVKSGQAINWILECLDESVL